jgi:hypothetical protein
LKAFSENVFISIQKFERRVNRKTFATKNPEMLIIPVEEP